MARAGLGLGLLLIGFAFLALLALVVIPVLPFGENHPTLMKIKGFWICDRGQVFLMEGHNFRDSRGAGRRFDVYCVGEGGERTDVAEKDLIVSTALFVVPFLTGLFLTITSIKGRAPVRMRRPGA